MGSKENGDVVNHESLSRFYSGWYVQLHKTKCHPKPNNLIIHCGTNNLHVDDPNDIAEKIIDVCHLLQMTYPNVRLPYVDLSRERTRQS